MVSSCDEFPAAASFPNEFRVLTMAGRSGDQGSIHNDGGEGSGRRSSELHPRRVSRQIGSKIDDHNASSGWHTPKLSVGSSSHSSRLHPRQAHSEVDDDNAGSGWRTPKFHPYSSWLQIESKVDDDGNKSCYHATALHPRRLAPQIPELVAEYEQEMLVDPDAETDDESAIGVVQKQSADVVDDDDNGNKSCYHATALHPRRLAPQIPESVAEHE